MTRSDRRDQIPIDDILDCVWRADMDLRLTHVSAAAVTMLGIPVDALIGSPIADLTTPGEFARLQERLNYALGRPDRTVGMLYETRIRHAEGHLIPVEVHSRLLLDAGGKPEGILGVIRDISGRRRTEKDVRDRENRRLQVQKMEAVGRLAGGVVDELQSLVDALSESRWLTDDPGLREHHRLAARRVDQLRTLAGRRRLQPQDLDVDAALPDILDAVRREFPPGLTLVHRPGAGRSTVRADSDQLGQVVRALCLNARDAMPDGGTVTVLTGMRDAEPNADEPPAASPRPWIVIEVTDTGSGLDALTRERILEPFFTTKEDGGGLGLALAHGIVAQHGGRFEVDSALGRGSTFRVLLPARFVGEATASEPAGTSLGVLLVDDDPEIRSYCSKVLQSAGFRVQTCDDGVEAIATIAGDEPIDLVVLDWALPGLDGRRVREQLARRTPRVPLMIISGHPRDQYVALGGIDAETPWLMKPFTPSALLAQVRALLAASARES